MPRSGSASARRRARVRGVPGRRPRRSWRKSTRGGHPTARGANTAGSARCSASARPWRGHSARRWGSSGSLRFGVLLWAPSAERVPTGEADEQEERMSDQLDGYDVIEQAELVAEVVAELKRETDGLR